MSRAVFSSSSNGSSVFVVNGKTISIGSGGKVSMDDLFNGSVSVNGGPSKKCARITITIDGQTTEYSCDKPINIDVRADRIGTVTTASADINITGNVSNLRSASGDVMVSGDVDSITSNCGDVNVKGDVKGDISVDCGDVRASGSVRGSCSVIRGNFNM